ncbi:FAD/NAD(P)-binding protein [Streptomyces sp. NPDC001904]|uniref:FAD/NAD(P)-binding protein n=1 Tax=Streptomyces sp. NPDC001904 TaxID=3154531 RepID=UPI0033283EB8
MSDQRPLAVAVVGLGPRGLSVLERLCANARHEPRPLTVHLIEPHEPGAGAVWRRDQSRHLLMNTVASQITAWTDCSSRIEGPVEPGPGLYDWARALATDARAAERNEADLAEARSLGPDTYPTRALYGAYLHWCFLRVVGSAPEHVAVVTHRARAVALADVTGEADGRQGLRMCDGTRLDALDGVVLAQGHLPVRPLRAEARLASLARIHHLTYVPPCNPAEAPVADLPAGEPVLLRGLGLNFFDYMALLTEGRGGRYHREGDRLSYEPSGREPLLYAFSRRGVPHHARGENQKGVDGRHEPVLLPPTVLADLQRRALDGRPVSFLTDLWPRISREVEAVYYRTLLNGLGEDQAARALFDEYLSISRLGTDGAPCWDEAETGALLRRYGVPDDRHWDWHRLARPAGSHTFADRSAFRDWLLRYLDHDAHQARQGNVTGPLKSALDVLRDLRNEIRLAVDHGALEGDSYRRDLQAWYTPLNAFLSIGPPAARVEEMAALVRAGLLTVTGPATHIRVDATEPGFTAHSQTVPGPPVRARALIEARLPDPDVRRADDPLMRHLHETGQIRPHAIPTASGGHYVTGGLSVTRRPYRVLDADGHPHPRRFAYGIPTETVHWVTAAGTRPGVDSVTLADADAIARALLSLRPASLPHPADRSQRDTSSEHRNDLMGASP